jgi:hypothetical protein
VGQIDSKLSNRFSTLDSHPTSPSQFVNEGSRRSNGYGTREPPADAFYYGPRSPTGTTMSARGETPTQGLQRSSDLQEVARTARDTLVLRVALEKAVLGGYLPDFQDSQLLDLEQENSLTSDDLFEELLRLQERCSSIKVSLRKAM